MFNLQILKRSMNWVFWYPWPCDPSTSARHPAMASKRADGIYNKVSTNFTRSQTVGNPYLFVKQLSLSFARSDTWYTNKEWWISFHLTSTPSTRAISADQTTIRCGTVYIWLARDTFKTTSGNRAHLWQTRQDVPHFIIYTHHSPTHWLRSGSASNIGPQREDIIPDLWRDL
jgi:hypothetical protein